VKHASIIKRLAVAAAALAAGATVFELGFFLYLKAELPDLSTIKNYDPPRSTRVYSDDGQLVGEIFRERRTVVPIESVPKHVVYAFLAAEDAAFYEHRGLDYGGILRAALKNLRPGAHLQGASTITQQTVKTLVVGAERSYTRKLKEAILTRELEQLLTKDEILYLYLNQIYFGAAGEGGRTSGAYGIEEAALTYFGKSIRDIDLGEGALLASIPKNPSHYTPAADPAAAKQRQRYVLEQMLQHGWTTADDVQKALLMPVPVPPPPPPYLGKAQHYVEHVKRLLIDSYGEDAVMTRGFTVYTGLNARMQAGGHVAVRLGLERFAKTIGYPGATLRIEVDRLARAKQVLHEAWKKRAEKASVAGGRRNSNLVWDLDALAAKDLVDEVALAAAVRSRPLAFGERVTGIVDKIDPVTDDVWVDLGSLRGRIAWASLKWARKVVLGVAGPEPRDPTEVLRPGDVVAVDIVDVPTVTSPKKVVALELVPVPPVESALVAIDPNTRFVTALVGGYGPQAGGLNRALQARRQPGSAFKPLVYAAGLTANAITPAATCQDSPVVIRDPWTGKAWKPENYEDGRYDGNITYRTALTRSKNTCSVKLIEKIGPEQVMSLAKAAGIESPMPQNLTLALGTGDVTPLELTNAYATIAASGWAAPPLFIRKVTEPTGAVIFEAQSQPTQALSPAVAYVLTTMMRSVVEEGTATKALILDRPLAGKTGTSNESRNVWFAGFSAELVAAVWVGYDDNAPMGRATGGSTALPIWIEFMGRALSGVPVSDFTPPAEVVLVKVDPATGNPSDETDAIEQAFLAGTEPSRNTQALPSIFIEDSSGEPLGPN
jgi:penicillin-binding protein 1A